MLNVIKTILNNTNAPQNRPTKPRTNTYEEYDDREFTKRLPKPTALAAPILECSFMGTTVFLTWI